MCRGPHGLGHGLGFGYRFGLGLDGRQRDRDAVLVQHAVLAHPAPPLHATALAGPLAPRTAEMDALALGIEVVNVTILGDGHPPPRRQFVEVAENGARPVGFFHDGIGFAVARLEVSPTLSGRPADKHTDMLGGLELYLFFDERETGLYRARDRVYGGKVFRVGRKPVGAVGGSRRGRWRVAPAFVGLLVPSPLQLRSGPPQVRVHGAGSRYAFLRRQVVGGLRFRTAAGRFSAPASAGWHRFCLLTPLSRAGWSASAWGSIRRIVVPVRIRRLFLPAGLVVSPRPPHRL